MPLDPERLANLEQARAWDGEEGAHWTAHAARYDAGVREYGEMLRDRAGISAHDVVLDVGCGNGASTRDAARAATNGRAVGIDLSSSMLAWARSTAAAESLTNVEFVQGDAQTHAFEAHAFSVAISRFGVMFFGDPLAAFTNIAHSLGTGGRLALVAWKPLEDNEWFSEIGRALALGRTVASPPAGTPSPFGLSDPDYVSGILGAAGFVDVEFDDLQAAFYLGADTDDAFTFARGLGFTRMMLQDADDEARARGARPASVNRCDPRDRTGRDLRLRGLVHQRGGGHRVHWGDPRVGGVTNVARYGDDIYTEADGDPDTLANLGPLRPMAGVWQSVAGDDIHPVGPGSDASDADIAAGTENNVFIEHYELQPIDPQTNGPQRFYGLRYHVHIVKPGEVETFHDQVGYWLWEPAACWSRTRSRSRRVRSRWRRVRPSRMQRPSRSARRSVRRHSAFSRTRSSTACSVR